jgi:hypothetical protein
VFEYGGRREVRRTGLAGEGLSVSAEDELGGENDLVAQGGLCVGHFFFFFFAGAWAARTLREGNLGRKDVEEGNG